LKRKENALGLTVGSFVGPEIGWTGSNEKANERSMLAHRFCIAPMMDWTDRAEKAKQFHDLATAQFSVQYRMQYQGHFQA
jgi:hypothetical protein